jgi:hypothetical protein
MPEKDLNLCQDHNVTSTKNNMPTLLIVDRTGTVKPLATKTYEEDILYKKAGFKTPTDFALHHVFSMGSYRIHLYGKTKGKAGQENKYDFPPPVDNVLFFGSCLLVNKREGGEVTDLPLKDWKAIYEKLFGGFEDLTAADEGEAGESETEEEKRIMADPNTKFTKQGYVKDDFIVDDEDDEDDDEDDDDEEEESASFSDDSDDRPRPKKKAAPKTKKAPVTRSKKAGAPKKAAAATARRARKEPTMVSEEPNATPVLQDELAEEEYFA